MSLENMTLEEIQFWSKGVSDTLNEIKKEGLYRSPECKKLIVGRPCDWNICGSGRREFGYGVRHFYTEIAIWSPADFESWLDSVLSYNLFAEMNFKSHRSHENDPWLKNSIRIQKLADFI